MEVVAGRGNGKKRTRRWKVTPRFWALLAAAFALYMAVSYATGFWHIWRLEREIARVRAELQRLEAENAALQAQLSYMQSDEYIEKVAREELGLVMPGETAVVVAAPVTDTSRVGAR